VCFEYNDLSKEFCKRLEKYFTIIEHIVKIRTLGI
jgi:hypothetical protein